LRQGLRGLRGGMTLRQLLGGDARRGGPVNEAEWLACDNPERMLKCLPGKASDRKLWLFAVACCRRIWELLPDPRSRAAVEAAEALADGRLRGTPAARAREGAHAAAAVMAERAARPGPGA